MSNRILLLIALQFSFCAIAGAEDSITCGSKIIDVGDSIEDVRRHCGKPTSVIDAGGREISDDQAMNTTMATTWHYRQPGGQIYAVLSFDMGKVRSIEHVDKMSDDL